MKKKEQPSKKIQSEIASRLTGYRTDAEHLVDDLSRGGIQLIAQQALEAEANDHLGRGYYERRGEDSPRTGYRNGYSRRTIKVATGRVLVQQPKLRGTAIPFRGQLIKVLSRLGHGMLRLATEMYVGGLSVRDIEQTFVDQNGKPLLSHASVSKITDELYREYEAFSQRDLSNLDVVYLFVDGVYEPIRHYTNNQTLLCAWAILSDGTKLMLHLSVVESESEHACTQFFEEMLNRGLRQPLLVISDGAKGLHAAIQRAFPKADRQRCIAHKLRNILAKLPKQQELRNRILEQLRAIYYAADRVAADVLSAMFIEEYADVYPAMVQCYSDDLQACLKHLDYPEGHRRFIRTTNTIERAFEEQKRRTKIIPNHPNERAAIKIVFGTLLRTSSRWRRVNMGKTEEAQLRKIRALKSKANDGGFISYRAVA